MSIIQIVLCLFLPFVAVFVKVGLGLHFWISILLCVFFWIPGVIHAFWVSSKK